MPFSRPHSYVLEELARRQAQQALLQQQARTNIGDAVGALKGLNADIEKQKAREAAQAQQALENQRAADAFSEEKAQHAAGNARADAELRLHQGADARAAAAAAAAEARAKTNDEREGLRFNTEQETQKRAAGKERIAPALKALFNEQGPKADIQGFVNSLVERPEFADVSPDDVLAAWRDLNVADADRQRGVDTAAAGRAMEERKQTEIERENRAQDAARLAAIAAGKEKAEAKADKLTPADEKRRSAVMEIEEREAAIKRNVDELKAQIKQYGTFELTGPESLIREQLLNEIATDMAKQVDVDSVARPSEVETNRKGLGPDAMSVGGLMSSDATIQAALDRVLARSKERTATAMKVRGITPDASGQVGRPAPPPGTTPAPSTDFVVVTDGKETLRIPREHLEEAKADGFHEVR